MKTVGEIVKDYMNKGATEGYGFSGRYGMIFFDLAEYANDQAPGYLTPKGYLCGVRPDGSRYRIGQICHQDFGWTDVEYEKAA